MIICGRILTFIIKETFTPVLFRNILLNIFLAMEEKIMNNYDLRYDATF